MTTSKKVSKQQYINAKLNTILFIQGIILGFIFLLMALVL